jgi:hypothetical protein
MTELPERPDADIVGAPDDDAPREARRRKGAQPSAKGGKDPRQAILERLAACDLATLERFEALVRRPPADPADSGKGYLDYLRPVAESDIAGLLKAEKSYGNSWKKRTGIGAFMMLARKWDRIEQRVATDIDATSGGAATRYDVFEHIAADRRVEGIIDDIRDLRRYLLLVESEMAARGIVEVGTARDNREKG